jgi:chemotaxis family two-component system sensor histidine kinase/response regulator PixL
MSKVVVIVDDSDSVAASLAIALEMSLDVRAIVTHHPRAALTLFAHEPDISIVVTDLNLPFLNGFKLIGALRKLRSYERLPALMITAEEDPELLNTSADCQPNVIMRKPFSFKEVCRVVELLLK